MTSAPADELNRLAPQRAYHKAWLAVAAPALGRSLTPWPLCLQTRAGPLQWSCLPALLWCRLRSFQVPSACQA